MANNEEIVEYDYVLEDGNEEQKDNANGNK
jgi:hypothetical protein